MNPSLTSRIFTRILKISSFKKRVEKRAFKKVQLRRKGFMPKRIMRSYSANQQTVKGKNIATFESREKVTNEHVIFFHGGAYIFGASIGHWKLAEDLVKRTKCRMTLIDYPLAPEHHYKETYSMVSDAYEMLLEQYPSADYIFMGDSSGGGIALAFAQKLAKEKHQKLPSKIILLSPWLDLTLSNPAIKKLEKSDHILSVKMLSHVGKLYANGGPQDNYLLSPLYGDFTGLPKTLVFYGTEELLHADCERIKTLTNSINQNFIFKELWGMQHDWAVFPIPERKQLIKEVSLFINS